MTCIRLPLVLVTLSLTFAPLFAAEPKLPGARPTIDASDYPSLQAAIDAVPRTGGMLRLPPGEFEISEPLVIRHGDFRMEGAGTATHIRNKNANHQPAVFIRSDEGDAKHKTGRKPLWRVMLGNFRVTGNANSGHGIEAVRVNEFFVQGVTISYHGGDGICCHFCYEDMRLNDSLITYNKQAGLRAVGNHDSIVSACQFEENLDAVVFTDGFNLTLTGNNIDDHLRHGVVIEDASASIVTGNMIEQCSGAGIVLDRNCYGIAISGNVFAQDLGGGVDLRDAHGIAISGNSFMRVKQFGVRASKDSGRSAVTGNTFSDSWVGDAPKVTGPIPGDPDINNSAGLLLESTSDMVVTGNTFTGLKTKPLTTAGECERLIFTSNAIIGCADGKAK